MNNSNISSFEHVYENNSYISRKVYINIDEKIIIFSELVTLLYSLSM